MMFLCLCKPLFLSTLIFLKLTMIMARFVKSQATICASYHFKVFGSPAPASIIPSKNTTKKSRKPKLTRAMPSADNDVFPFAGKSRDNALSNPLEREKERELEKREDTHSNRRYTDDGDHGRERPLSRAPSRAASDISTTSTQDNSFLRRSLSRTESQSQSQSQILKPQPSIFHRSRSHSTDTLGSGTKAGLAGEIANNSMSAPVLTSTLTSTTVGATMSASTAVFSSGPATIQVSTSTATSLGPPLGGMQPLKKTKSLIRAPSGKDLFKGREVGLRRVGSKKAEAGKGLGLGWGPGEGQGQSLSQSLLQPQSQSQSHSQTQLQSQSQSQSQGQLFGRGLMGRKTSGSKDKLKSKSERERDQGHDPHTLIMATPAKPRMHLANPSGAHFWHPTPIQEESLSKSSTSLSSMSLTSRLLSLDRERGPRPAFVAETPVGVRMVSDWQYAEDEEEGDEGLGELMVMTDDEDGDEEERGEKRGFVPATPVK